MSLLNVTLPLLEIIASNYQSLFKPWVGKKLFMLESKYAFTAFSDDIIIFLFGIPSVTKCEILGMEIPFSLNFIQKKVTHAISTLTTWKKFRFSLFTSIIIINSYFLPKFQHLYPYIYFGENIHKQIQDAIKWFLYSNNITFQKTHAKIDIKRLYEKGNPTPSIINHRLQNKATMITNFTRIFKPPAYLWKTTAFINNGSINVLSKTLLRHRTFTNKLNSSSFLKKNSRGLTLTVHKTKDFKKIINSKKKKTSKNSNINKCFKTETWSKLYSLSVSPKVKSFLIKLYFNAVPNKHLLKKKKIQIISYKCPLCKSVEEINVHICYKFCPVFKQLFPNLFTTQPSIKKNFKL